MSMFKILKEAQSKLINHHIENLVGLKPFNNRLVSLILSLESLSDSAEKNRTAAQIDLHSVQSLRKLVQHIKWRSFNNQISKEQFRDSCSHLRHSLAYFEPESELELRSGDGIEEFIFAVYEVEKKHSGVDYLSLDDEPSHNFASSTPAKAQNIKSISQPQKQFQFQEAPLDLYSQNSHKEFEEQNSSGRYEGLWTVAEASNEEGDSDNPENQKNSPKTNKDQTDKKSGLQENPEDVADFDPKIITPQKHESVDCAEQKTCRSLDRYLPKPPVVVEDKDGKNFAGKDLHRSKSESSNSRVSNFLECSEGEEANIHSNQEDKPSTDITDEQDLEQHLERIKEDIRRLEFRTYRKEIPKREPGGEANHRSEDRLQMTKTLKNSSSLTISQQSDNFQSDSTVKTPKIHDRQLLKKIVDIIEKMFIRKKHRRQTSNFDSSKTKKKKISKAEKSQEPKTSKFQQNEGLNRQKKNRLLEPPFGQSENQQAMSDKGTRKTPSIVAQAEIKPGQKFEILDKLEEGLKRQQEPLSVSDYKFLVHRKSQHRHDSRKFSRGSNSATSFVGMENISEDAQSNDGGLLDARKASYNFEDSEMKKTFQQMLEEHRQKQKLVSNPFSNIPESEYELDPQSAYKPQKKLLDTEYTKEEGHHLKLGHFSSLDHDQMNAMLGGRTQDLRSDDLNGLASKENSDSSSQRIQAINSTKPSKILGALKEFKVSSVSKYSGGNQDWKKSPSELISLMATSIGKTVPDRQYADQKFCENPNQYSRSFVTHSEVDVSQHRRLKSEIQHSGLQSTDPADSIQKYEAKETKNTQSNQKAYSRLHAILKDLGGSYQHVNSQRSQLRGNQTERLSTGRLRDFGFESKLRSSREITDSKAFRQKGKKQISSKNQNHSLTEHLLPSYSELRQSFKKGSNFEDIVSRAKQQLSLYKNRRVSNSKGLDKALNQKTSKNAAGITDIRRDTPYPERLSTREGKDRDYPAVLVNPTLKKISNQGLDSMFQRRLNVRLPDTKNSSIDSASSHQLEREGKVNTNLAFRQSTDITSPKLRVASLTLRTSEALFPRDATVGAERREELIESIKNKYLKRLEFGNLQGQHTSRLPFTSPKGSLKTSALSERALSPDPVSTPKLLNLIKDFKKSQGKTSKQENKQLALNLFI